MALRQPPNTPPPPHPSVSISSAVYIPIRYKGLENYCTKLAKTVENKIKVSYQTFRKRLKTIYTYIKYHFHKNMVILLKDCNGFLLSLVKLIYEYGSFSPKRYLYKYMYIEKKKSFKNL